MDTLIDNMFGPTIYAYTRAQAIDDGMLIDVSEMAREAGFCVPVAITAAAWDDCVAWSSDDSKRQTHQDETGRLWDVLWMASVAARMCRDEMRDTIYYRLHRVPRGGRGRLPRLAKLKIVASAGDAGEPVLTIMLPTED